MEEIFRKFYIEGYRYIEVNNLGTVVKNKKGVPLLFRQDSDGYYFIRVHWGGKKKPTSRTYQRRVHRLVAETFIDNPNNYKEVNHIDGNKHNNSVKNLEWCTRSHNVKHAYDNNLKHGSCDEDNGRAKLTSEQVKQIREIYNGKNVSIYRLAKDYNMSWSMIKLIITNKNWKIFDYYLKSETTIS